MEQKSSFRNCLSKNARMEIFSFSILKLMVITAIEAAPLVPKRVRHVRDSDDQKKIELTTNNQYYEYNEGDLMKFNCNDMTASNYNLTMTIRGDVVASGKGTVQLQRPAMVEDNDQKVFCTLRDHDQREVLQISRIITVYYSPRRSDDGCTDACVIKGAYAIGEKATVVVRVRANPKPYLYSWSDEQIDLDRGRFNQVDAGQVHDEGIYWEARLEIDTVEPQDFDTTFKFEATNDHGSVSFDFTIANQEISSYSRSVALALLVIFTTAVIMIVKKAFTRKDQRSSDALLLTSKTQIYLTTIIRKDRMKLIYKHNNVLDQSSDIWRKIDAAKKSSDKGNCISPFPTATYIQESFIDNVNADKWQLVFDARGKWFGKVSNGFHGRLYLDAARMQLVLVLANNGMMKILNRFKDNTKWMLMQRAGTLYSAFTFAERVRLFVSEFECQPQLFITGESLGGFLAQISTFAVKNCSIDEATGNIFFNKEQGMTAHPRALVFDCPEARKYISSIVKNESREVYDTLDINNFIRSSSSREEERSLLKDPEDDACIDNMRLRTREFQRGIDKRSFLDNELRALRVQPLYRMVDKILDFDIPANKVETDCVTLLEDTSQEEFIPKVRALVQKHGHQLEEAEKLVQQKFMNMLLLNKGLIVDRIESVDFKLSDEMVAKVCSWSSGTQVCGLLKDSEKVLFAQILQNTISNLFFLAATDFCELNLHNCMFNGVLVVIEDQLNFKLPETGCSPKILSLVRSKASGSDCCQEALKLQHLDQQSQSKLRKMVLHFMGAEISAEQLFGSKIAEFTIFEILSLTDKYYLEPSSENCFYFEQCICSDDKENEFSGSIEDLTNLIIKRPQDCYLLSGGPGAGKSIAMKRIILELKKKLAHYCVIHCNISTIDIIKGQFTNLDIIANILVHIVQRQRGASILQDEVLEKLIRHKLELKEVIFISDDFNQVEVLQKEKVKSLIKALNSIGTGVIVAARSMAIMCTKFKSTFSLKPVSKTDRCKFVSQYIQSSEESINEKKIDELFKEAKEDDLWGLPLNLMLVAEALKDASQSATCLFKLLIAGATIAALKHKVEAHYEQLSNSLLKNVHRLAACAILKKGKYTEIKFDINDKSIEFLKDFKLLSMNSSSQTVSFTHPAISEYLLAEAVVRALHQDPNVDSTHIDDKSLSEIFTNSKYQNMRSYMNNILLSFENNSAEVKKINWTLQTTNEILIGLIKERKFEIYKMLEASQSKINYKKLWDLKTPKLKECALYVALEYGNEDFVEHLVQKGATLDAIPSGKLYTLHWAVKFASLNQQVMKGFMKYAARVNEPHGATKKTPLGYATESGNTGIVQFLNQQETKKATKR